MILIALIAIAVADQAAELRIIDETQRAMVGRADVAGLEGITHPRLRINAPGGRVLDRETFFRNMRSGAIGAEAFTRTPETVSVTADIGIVMGRESFTPTAASELGRDLRVPPATAPLHQHLCP